ncbi:MAG: bifunctional methylenetetrahydrofolate dehydrogenase/methenyltetrahydrofolate cyclohydrolase FolD [Sphaerochaetaceae bacterium]|nr:bifunctional methylenetetrahydrofolate dehydrogenase/methenyltetrahydrofolate cyclohydrolase FolD [Sphaerochaetaceae bacterium]
MQILSGKELSAQVKSQVADKCMEFEKRFSRKPCLAVVLVGDNPASQTYVKSKKKACEELGIAHLDIDMDKSTSQDELLKCIASLNDDPAVDGILVQMPLPSQIDELAITNAICPEKDVDGFHPQNIGKLLLGQETLIACTPKGILRILDHYGIQTDGKDVCVLGRSNIVGKPMAALLMQKDRNATVTVCHSRSSNAQDYLKRADIIIAAVGHVNAVTSDMVKDGAVIIDVGINRVPDATKKTGYAIKGDVDYEDLSAKVSAMTPVPGGVGPMTIAMLMENTFIAACRREGVNPESFGNEVNC